MVVASGNNAQDRRENIGIVGDLDNPLTAIIPTEVEQVITVAASRSRDADGGSDVRSVVDVAAPGGDEGPNGEATPNFKIISTWVDIDPFIRSFLGLPVDLTCTGTEDCTVGFASSTGTSMAVPHVSGTVGLMYDAFRSRGRLTRGGVGAGVINTARAVERMQ